MAPLAVSVALLRVPPYMSRLLPWRKVKFAFPALAVSWMVRFPLVVNVPSPAVELLLKIIRPLLVKTP